MGWLLHLFGIDTTTGPWYAFWSGAGSDIGELALLAAVWGWWHQHNCEVHRCWRLGRHQTAAGHRACRKHHPDGHLTAGALHTAHREAKAKRG